MPGIQWIAFARVSPTVGRRLQGRIVSLPLTRGSVPRPAAGRHFGLRQPPDPHKEGTKDERISSRSQLLTLVGNLTADPVTKQLDEDRKVCQLRSPSTTVKDQPMFIDVATFGAQADACAKYLTKGRAVAVTGRLVYREWETDNGTRRITPPHRRTRPVRRHARRRRSRQHTTRGGRRLIQPAGAGGLIPARATLVHEYLNEPSTRLQQSPRHDHNLHRRSLSASIPSINLIGRLTADPTLNERKGIQVGNLRLAVQRPRKDGEDQGADYVDVTVFGRQAEICKEYLAKGRKIAVQGRLHHSEWDGENGRRQKLEVNADSVEFLDPRKRDEDSEPEPVEAAA